MLYQLLRPDEDSTSTERYIDSRTVQLKAKGAWMSVDVTETIKDWVSDPGEIQQPFSVRELPLHHQLIFVSFCSLVREQPGPENGRPLSLLHLRPVHQQHRSQQE